MVKLVDLATSGGKFDENFIVVGPKTDFTIVIVRFLTTHERPLSENVKNRGAAVAGPYRPGLTGPASPNLGNVSQGEAAEDLGPYRADDASESGAGSMKSGGSSQLGERSERGTVAGDSADDDDAVATSDLVVRQKNPVFGGVGFFEMIGVKVMLVSLDVDLHPVKRDCSSPPPPSRVYFIRISRRYASLMAYVFKSLR